MKIKLQTKIVLITILPAIITIAILFLIIMPKVQKNREGEVTQNKVTNFEECVMAGNSIMESYPRQCRHNKTTYVEDIEAQKIKKIQDNDLIMETIRQDSGVSMDLLANSCASSIMQETNELIMVYIRWNCSDVGGGTRAILKKQNGNYKFIATLQDWPNCALMEEFSVPKSFYEMCY